MFAKKPNWRLRRHPGQHLQQTGSIVCLCPAARLVACSNSARMQMVSVSEPHCNLSSNVADRQAEVKSNDLICIDIEEICSTNQASLCSIDNGWCACMPANDVRAPMCARQALETADLRCSPCEAASMMLMPAQFHKVVAATEQAAKRCGPLPSLTICIIVGWVKDHHRFAEDLLLYTQG